MAHHAELTLLLWLTCRPIFACKDQQKLVCKAQHGAPSAPDVAWRSTAACCCGCLGGWPHVHCSHDAKQCSCKQPSPGPGGHPRQPCHQYQRPGGRAGGGASHHCIRGAVGIASRYWMLAMPSSCCSISYLPYRCLICYLCDPVCK